MCLLLCSFPLSVFSLRFSTQIDFKQGIDNKLMREALPVCFDDLIISLSVHLFIYYVYSPNSSWVGGWVGGGAAGGFPSFCSSLPLLWIVAL
jgi:hypothetical protein